MRKIHHIRLLITIVSIGLLFSSCGKKEKIPQSLSYSPEIAKMVSEVTSGVVSAGGWIKVRFAEPMVDEREVSDNPDKPKALDKKLFQFDPKIKGVAFWQDVRTLVFKPAKPMAIRTTYTGTLDVERLLPAKPKKSIGSLPIQFVVTAREVVSFSGDLAPANENNPALLKYQGEIEFTESVPLKDLKEAGQLSVNSKKWGLEWEQETGGRKFRFRSAVMQRNDKEKNIQFSIDKARLTLGSDFLKTAFMPPLTVMEVTDMAVKTGEREGTIVITFSDELDSKRDAAGRISIEPGVTFKAATAGKEIQISGKFDFGKAYTVRVRKGVRSRWGTTTSEDYVKALQLEDIKPQIRFASDGVFVSSTNRQKIRFETVNVRRVLLNVKKVFESNLGQFLQTEKLEGPKSRSEGFREWELERVGVDAANDTLEIGERKNVWLQHELDLQNIFKTDPKGLFLINLQFRRKDMIYGDAEAQAGSDSEEDGYYYGSYDVNDPGSYAYLHQFGRIYKPIVFSDIGLTCKSANRRFLVFATDIRDASPLGGATVTLRTYQNQVAGRSETNGSGVAEFQSVSPNVFCIEAEKNGQRSVIKLNEMAWNLSGFDTGGEWAAPDGLRAFLYTERGVYRPGDEIHLCLIARNPDGTFPDGHPVTLKVFNPKNQLALEETRKDGADGFYHFNFSTHPEDPTGNWLAQCWIGGRNFDQPLKIETVVPYTLKVEMKTPKEQLGPKDQQISLDLSAKTLFGAPAGGYPATVEATFIPIARNYSQFPGFLFDNTTVQFESQTETIFSGPLDGQGNARIDWTLPALDEAPSALEASVVARVIEKSGRPNLYGLTIPIDPYARYVGVKPPVEDIGYVRVGTTLDIPVILVNGDGSPSGGRNLAYRVYRNQQWWWWQYENESDYRLRFKSDKETQLIKEGGLTSGEKPVLLHYSIGDRGEYFIEIQDGKEGHTAGFFFSAYAWGEVPSGGDKADLLALKSDRKQYRPGDEAEISFPSPKEGSILVTVEKGSRVLSFKWVEPSKTGDQTSVSIPVNEEMMPNAYVTVSVLQPLSQTLNDRPLRMCGILPISVVDPETRQEIILKAPASFEPDKKCTVDLETSDHRPTQFTLAVVDEGLLDLTRFATPDPWKAFYKKERLGVDTYDLFSQVVGVNKGDVFRTFSIGGDMEEAFRQSQLGAEKTKRFKPVVVFRGPVKTDKSGRARIQFDMPSYVGSVRVMAVAARGRTYGCAEKAVPVKTDLIAAPGLPRVLGPGDRIVMPVTVYAMEKVMGDVAVSVETKGSVSILENAKKNIRFADKGEQDVRFDLTAQSAVGTAVITVKAASSKRTVQSVTEIAVRSSSPRIFESQEKVLPKGEKVSMVVPNKGLQGTNQATVTLWRRPPMNLDRRLKWLIQYPYGCIEQTVSSVFPQLYLKTILKTSLNDEQAIDRNINGGIQRLRKFQLASGGFATWPGCKDISVWGTDYAGHFLVEAKKLGYSVPEDLYRKWLSFEKNQIHNPSEPAFVQAHRLYMLALAGSPQIGAMNLLKEDSLRVVNDAAKWLLAGAYQLAGVGKTAQEILVTAGTKVGSGKPCWYWWHTYGTELRDRAMILEMQVLFERWQDANLIVDEFAKSLFSNEWYSTQTTGHMLLAIGKYLKGNETGKLPVISGSVRLPDGQTKKFKTDAINYSVEILSGFGKPVEIILDDQSTVNRVFCEVTWNGVPLEPDFTPVNRNLSLDVEWLNENGEAIDPTQLKQGTVFWGHFRASPSNRPTPRIDEVALVQVLPSGWEIENVRLSGENMPPWMSKYALNRFEYLDIRDDRIMWFFDFMPSAEPKLDFVVKLNAVTPGTFVLPPTLLEAMYDADYQARKGGSKVSVE